MQTPFFAVKESSDGKTCGNETGFTAKPSDDDFSSATRLRDLRFMDKVRWAAVPATVLLLIPAGAVLLGV